MFALVLVPVLLLILYWFINYLWFERHLRKFPGPTPLPLLGSALDFTSPKTQLKKLLQYGEKYGDFKLYVGFEPFVFLCDLKGIELMMSSTTDLTKSKQYQFLNNWLGNGLLISNGNYWRRHRKIITPAFHFQILDRYVEAFNSASETLINCLRSQSGKGDFDIAPYMGLCTLDIMCESTMGVRVNAQLNAESNYVNCIKKMGDVLNNRSFSATLQYDWLYMFTETYREEKKSLKVLHEYSRSVISKKKQEMEENGAQDFDEDVPTKKKLAFLDLLLSRNNTKDGLTDDEVREEVDTLLFEGHDTTSSAISFTLYALSNHQDIQEKVYKEVISILSDDPDIPPTCKDLNEMKYLEMVIKESLRLYPPVPSVARKLERDVKYGDKVLPKGISVGMLSMVTQLDPKLFPNPTAFDPDRFLPENTVGRNPYAYLPFSAGARNCIGQKFAVLEMKSTISRILRHYKLLPTIPKHEVELTLDIVMRSANGVMLRLENRK